MKKFKEFYKKAANPQTPEDWVDATLLHSAGDRLIHSELQGRKMFNDIKKYLEQSAKYEMQFTNRFHVYSVEIATNKRIYMAYDHYTGRITMSWNQLANQ